VTSEPLADPARTGRRGGLIVPVPEAEAACGLLPAPCLPVWQAGVPAHVTLLFPFHTAAALGPAGLTDLAQRFASLAPVRVSFDHTDRFPEILYLCPEPRGWFLDLTHALAAQYGLSPYGGLHADIVPHLTVARHPDPAALAAAEEALQAALPIVTLVREVWLMEEEDDERWHRAAVFPLSGTAGAPVPTSPPDVTDAPG
jgi:2'-5' RNA ligase